MGLARYLADSIFYKGDEKRWAFMPEKESMTWNVVTTTLDSTVVNALILYSFGEEIATFRFAAGIATQLATEPITVYLKEKYIQEVPGKKTYSDHLKGAAKNFLMSVPALVINIACNKAISKIPALLASPIEEIKETSTQFLPIIYNLHNGGTISSSSHWTPVLKGADYIISDPSTLGNATTVCIMNDGVAPSTSEFNYSISSALAEGIQSFLSPKKLQEVAAKTTVSQVNTQAGRGVENFVRRRRNLKQMGADSANRLKEEQETMKGVKAPAVGDSMAGSSSRKRNKKHRGEKSNRRR